MLAQQVPRRIARSSIAWSRPPIDVYIFCRSASTPDYLRRAYAKYTPPKAPSTRNRLWREKARVATAQEKKAWSDPNLPGGRFLPPLDIVEILQKSGLIKADPPVVLRLLDAMREMGSKIDGPMAKKLCLEHGVALDDMFFIARGCLYSRNSPTVRKLGKTVLLTMAANEVPQATLHLLRTAIKQDEGFRGVRKAYDSPELALARHHLRKLLADKHPQAMVFEAKRLADAGKRKEAIAMLQDAIARGATEVQTYEEDAEEMHKKYSSVILKDHEAEKGESPWTVLANLQAAEKDFEGAKEAFRAGALNDDDPRAYEGLAGTFERYSPLWLEYITKAAASGSWTAMSHLGSFYSAPLDKIRDEKLRREMERLENSGAQVEWWYYYLDDEELAAIGQPPGTKLIGADFWRSFRESTLDSTLQMVRLNTRQTLAIEWFELAWRSQFIFRDSQDLKYNIAMQEIIESAAPEQTFEGDPKNSLFPRLRHRKLHHSTRERMMWERITVEVNELTTSLRHRWDAMLKSVGRIFREKEQ